MSNPFRALQGCKAKQESPDDMALELARDACERYLELKADALAREAAAEAPAEWTPEAEECMATIDALMRGRHKHVVIPIVLAYFPELLTSANPIQAKMATLVLPDKGKVH